MGSVVIPAHDEEVGVGGLLTRLAPLSGRHEVVVVCNGCSDHTADVVRATAPWAQLIELPAPGKPAALDAGDAAVSTFPRVYLDADVVIDADAVQALMDVVEAGAPSAAATPRYDLSRSSRLVRSHFALWSELPANRSGLAGTNAMAVSRSGRGRFEHWPALIGDDYFLDGRFAASEKSRVEHAAVVRSAPRGARDCISRRARIMQGNDDVLAAGLRSRHQGAGLGATARLVRSRPALAVHLPAHLLITVGARLLVRWRRWRGTSEVWFRDDSREPAAAAPSRPR